MALNAVAPDPVNLYVFDHEQALRLCRECGIGLSTLSTLTGRGANTLRSWLRDDGDPPSSIVSALALILGVRPGDLYRPATETDTAVEVLPLVQVVTPPRHRRRLARRTEDVRTAGGRL
jgi:hypothetical protein